MKQESIKEKYSDKNTVRLMALLQSYFKGQKTDFNVKIDLSSLSDFTQKVLRATQKIPYGKTRTYSAIAKEIGCPKASRAVGRALARNPLPIVIPCHRVIRKINH